MIPYRTGGTRAFRSRTVVCLVTSLALYTCFCGSASTRDTASAQTADASLVQAFQETPEEEVAITRWEIGNTIISNEDRLELFKKHVDDIGGGYVGLGGTQNILLASWANSEWVWLFDFTKRVVTANRIHIAFLKNTENPADFRSLWTKKSKSRAMEIIDAEFSKDPDLAYVKKTWNIGLGFIPWRFRNLDRESKKYKYSTWLNDQKYFDRIKFLAKNDRIIARKGNLNGTVTLAGIAGAAKKMRVPVRIVYLSNAEEYIHDYSSEFRSNFIALPSDEKSVLLRTTSVMRKVFPWAPDSEISTDKGFHYNVMPLAIFQKWLDSSGRKLYVIDMMRGGDVNMKDGFSFASKPPKSETKQKKDAK